MMKSYEYHKKKINGFKQIAEGFGDFFNPMSVAYYCRKENGKRLLHINICT
jgi:hypothetical protein